MRIIRTIPRSTLKGVATMLVGNVPGLTGDGLLKAIAAFDERPREQTVVLQPQPGELLTVTEVANRLKVCRKTVYNMIDRGVLTKVKIGSATRIPAAAIVALSGKEV